MPTTIDRQTLFTILAGLLSGIVFSATAYSGNGGLMLIFLPLIPLALPGLAFSARQSFFAAIAACVTIILFIDVSSMLLYAIFTAFPVCYLIRKILLHKDNIGQGRVWHPILPILAQLSAISAAMFMLIVITALYQQPGQLKDIIAHELSGNFNNLDASTEHYVKLIVQDYSFLIFAFASWVWVVMIYGFVFLANKILRYNKLALRETLDILPGCLPAWLLVVIIISAGLAFLTQGNDRFAGEAVFLMLLLPYLLCGLATLHLQSRTWPYRRLWLTLIYVIMIFVSWPILVLIAMGFYRQLMELRATKL